MIKVNQILVFAIGLVLLTANVGFSQGRNWDPEEYLKRADQNGNGQIDADEMGRRLSRYIKGLGFSTDQPVPVADILNRSRGTEKKNSEQRAASSASKAVERKVPGFGVETEPRSGVARFSNGQSTTSDPAVLEKQFSEGVMKRVRETLAEYDANSNGQLDPEEVSRGRWGRPSPEESDLNQNGSLSMEELAKRYEARENGNRRGRDRGNSNDNSDSSSEARSRAREAAARAAEEREDEDDDDNEGEARPTSRRSRWGRRSSGDTSTTDARARAREAAEQESRLREKERSRDSNERDSNERDSDEGDSENKKSDTSRFERFADGLMRSMDKDKNGSLDVEEMKRFRRPPKNVDADSDGIVTRQEIVDAYSRQSEESSDSKDDSSRDSSEEEESSSSRSSRDSRTSSSRSDRSSSRSSSSRSTFSFSKSDENQDGMIQMQEYAKDWTAEKIEEFKRIDRNNDGMLTKEEFGSR